MLYQHKHLTCGKGRWHFSIQETAAARDCGIALVRERRDEIGLQSLLCCSLAVQIQSEQRFFAEKRLIDVASRTRYEYDSCCSDVTEQQLFQVKASARLFVLIKLNVNWKSARFANSNLISQRMSIIPAKKKKSPRVDLEFAVQYLFEQPGE